MQGREAWMRMLLLLGEPDTAAALLADTAARKQGRAALGATGGGGGGGGALGWARRAAQHCGWDVRCGADAARMALRAATARLTPLPGGLRPQDIAAAAAAVITLQMTLRARARLRGR
eukprot:364653-Chlamydomonas_euryale.AAC.13